MERKKKVLTSIQETEEEIAGLRAEESEPEINTRSSLKTFHHEVLRLKQEIRARVKENVSFIEETLSFFDEIVSIFAAGGRQDYSYRQLLQRQTPAQSILFESEA
ncbi:MAG: hypothetical protein C4576_33320 [Desulfobacteraceae bacterium]|nr:MAG: hypothetical protein C4576_33320 [Desulfobacteraceae bacterium]